MAVKSGCRSKLAPLVYLVHQIGVTVRPGVNINSLFNSLVKKTLKHSLQALCCNARHINEVFAWARHGVALANSIPFSLSVPVWPVRRTYFGVLGAKTVPYL